MLSAGWRRCSRSSGAPISRIRSTAYAGDLIGLLVGAAAYEDSLYLASGVGFDEMMRFVGEFRRYLESLPPDRFPNLVELAGPLTRVSPDENERFEFMLNVIVDGLAAQH